MLGIAPLGSVPLAATLPFYLSDSGNLASITFGGYARPRARIHRAASGTIQFAGRAEATISKAGIVFTAIPESFEFRAEKISYDFTAMPQSFTFRGKPE